MDRDSVLRLEGIYQKGYGIVPKFVMHDPDLSLESKAIYAYLCALAGSGNTTFPYRNTILRDLGLSKNTYYNHYNPLIEQGYITVSRPADKSAANIYTIASNPKKLEDKRPGPDQYDAMLLYRGLKSRGYGTIPKTVMTDSRLSIKAKGLYAYFCSYCGAGDCAFPKRDDIIFHLNISEPTYYKSFKQLRELGYMEAVQRKNGNHFGVNDYYLNEYAVAEEPPCPKNCDMKENQAPSEAKKPSREPEKHDNKSLKSSCPKIRDTMNRDTTTPDTGNCDIYSNNSISNNNSSKINPSIRRKKTDGQAEPEEKARAEIIRQMPGLNAAKADELYSGFMDHFRRVSRDKPIRNLSAYMKTSLDNWLKEQPVREALGKPPASRTASYDLAAMERMVELGSTFL